MCVLNQIAVADINAEELRLQLSGPSELALHNQCHASKMTKKA